MSAARDAGFAELRLLAPGRQDRALRFYEREGFESLGEPFLVEAFGLTVIEMRRPLR